ncbi:MAG: hypothetical protein DRN15_06595 [Thermoprotei archaeon]|nr:MAG: hypothetical protein DRM97_04990 [Thermoprotei archaeon]RLF23371.1 MAG: hypothetical protein DRN15_06595 [Thermoprotei archaeon]
MSSERPRGIGLSDIEPEKVYEAIYWAIRDTFQSALEEAYRNLSRRNPHISKEAVLLNIIYEAIKEGVYKAMKEFLSSQSLSGIIKRVERG